LYFNPNDKQREDMIKGNTSAMKKNIMNRINHILSELEELEKVLLTTAVYPLRFPSLSLLPPRFPLLLPRLTRPSLASIS
jgi:hypothetical protein